MSHWPAYVSTEWIGRCSEEGLFAHRIAANFPATGREVYILNHVTMRFDAYFIPARVYPWRLEFARRDRRPRARFPVGFDHPIIRRPRPSSRP